MTKFEKHYNPKNAQTVEEVVCSNLLKKLNYCDIDSAIDILTGYKEKYSKHILSISIKYNKSKCSLRCLDFVQVLHNKL